jgi:hypothetical protein
MLGLIGKYRGGTLAITDEILASGQQPAKTFSAFGAHHQSGQSHEGPITKIEFERDSI